MIGQKGIPAAYGGVERHVEDLARELGLNGHEVLVYARKWFIKNAPKQELTNVQRVVTPTIHTKHLDAIVHTFISTLHAIFISRPDIIHYHGVGPSLLAWIPRVLAPRAKVFVTFHCIDRYHQKWGPIAKFFLRLGERTACAFAHQTIAVSKSIQQYCLNEYQARTHYIPNGVNLPGSVGLKALAPFGLAKNKYILMASRLVPHKGAHYLIAAWQYACRQNASRLKNYKLAIVGGSTFTDDYVKTLHALGEKDKSIVFTDWQSGPALSALYGNAALLVHPSENEGLPITVLEAMAHGRPVLVSDIAEHQEIIHDQNFLFKTGSVGSLADQILKLLANAALLKSAGIKNRLDVADRFNWNHITKDTIRLYEDARRKPFPISDPVTI